jgi:hypothetical protein
MHDFTKRLAERIESADSNIIGDALIDVGEAMRIWLFFGGSPTGSAIVGPFSEQADYPHFQSDDIERLKQALLKFAKNHPRHPELARAVFAFGYLKAPDTKTILIEILRDSIGRDSAALYQTILALESLGENLYGQRWSTSFDEVERNEKVAREYLLSHPKSI